MLRSIAAPDLIDGVDMEALLAIKAATTIAFAANCAKRKQRP